MHGAILPEPRRLADHAGERWGATRGKIGFHGGKVDVRRPRLRSYDGHEVELPTWRAALAEDWLGRWAMNLMRTRQGGEPLLLSHQLTSSAEYVRPLAG